MIALNWYPKVAECTLFNTDLGGSSKTYISLLTEHSWDPGSQPGSTIAFNLPGLQPSLVKNVFPKSKYYSRLPIG